MLTLSDGLGDDFAPPLPSDTEDQGTSFQSTSTDSVQTGPTQTFTAGAGTVTMAPTPAQAPAASNSSGAYTPLVAYGQSNTGFVPVAVPGANPTTSTNPLATSLANLGIPTWALYAAGGLLAAGILFLVTRRVKERGFAGDDSDGLDDYEVHHGGRVYPFPSAGSAKAQARLLEREYGGHARVLRAE